MVLVFLWFTSLSGIIARSIHIVANSVIPVCSFDLESVAHIYGEGNDTPLQHSCLENPMDGGAWGAAIHGVAKRRTRLSDFTFTFHFHALEKEMATPSSVLAWRIPGMGEPGGLPSMGSHRVGHDWNDLEQQQQQQQLIYTLYGDVSCLKELK